MILDKLSNLGLYQPLNPLFPVAYDYLRRTDVSLLAPGRYEIQGKDLYALMQEYATRTRDQSSWEAHHEYVDLHVMLRGEELVGFANVADLRSLGDYEAAKDVEHFEGDGTFLKVPEGYFVIFGTQDAHMPCLEPGRPATVRKLVLKIRAR